MHKSYKRKNSRNKTRKKYYKVGGGDGDDDPIIEPITSLENSMPIFIGYTLLPSNSQAYKPTKLPLWVKKDIDSKTFLEIIGNRHKNNLIDLKAVYSLPNVRLPFSSAQYMIFDDDEDNQIFELGISKQGIQRLQVKYNNLFKRLDAAQIKTMRPDEKESFTSFI